MKTTAVLMSTYNGEKFLREQIDSVLSQQGVDVRLYIRDDGSSDDTTAIISEYTEKNDNISFLQGNNVGVGSSFMALVRAAGTAADFFAFADQDDIWLPDKLERAVSVLSEKTGPWCYCSNQTLVDSEGNVIRQRHEAAIDAGYMQILCNNMVTGCTMVWNKDLQTLLVRNTEVPSPELLRKRIHDVWVAMVAAVTGNIYYDPDSFILYRQHENNVVGAKGTGRIQEWKKKLRRPELRNGRSELAKEIAANYGDVIKDIAISSRLNGYAAYRDTVKGKLLLLKDNSICRYSGESGIMYRIKVMAGLF